MNNIATDCIQNIRPISNLLDSIYTFSKEATKSKFRLIFGDQLGGDYFDSFIKSERNFFVLYSKLTPIEKARLGNYIEANTSNYDVLKYVEKDDLKRFMAADNLILPSIVRDVNWAKYSGNLDENSILQWIKKNKTK